MRFCKKCSTEKELDEFYNGVGYCIQCIKSGYQLNRSKILKYKQDNKKSISDVNKKYYLSNRDKFKVKNSEYYKLNKDNIKRYQKDNIENIRDCRRKYSKNRRDVDLIFKLSGNIRNLIKISLRKKIKGKTEDILGCKIEDFKNHLESKFEKWMSWDNYGLFNGETEYGWDIDHIIPVSSAKTKEDLIKLNHFSNMRPLCSYNNRYVKKDNLIYEQL